MPCEPVGGACTLCSSDSPSASSPPASERGMDIRLFGAQMTLGRMETRADCWIRLCAPRRAHLRRPQLPSIATRPVRRHVDAMRVRLLARRANPGAAPHCSRARRAIEYRFRRHRAVERCVLQCNPGFWRHSDLGPSGRVPHLGQLVSQGPHRARSPPSLSPRRSPRMRASSGRRAAIGI